MYSSSDWANECAELEAKIAALQEELEKNVREARCGMTYVIVRYPCLPEDEGRTHVIKTCSTKEEAEKWVQEQEGEYFRPGDYGILRPLLEDSVA